LRLYKDFKLSSLSETVAIVSPDPGYVAWKTFVFLNFLMIDP